MREAVVSKRPEPLINRSEQDEEPRLRSRHFHSSNPQGEVGRVRLDRFYVFGRRRGPGSNNAKPHSGGPMGRALKHRQSEHLPHRLTSCVF